MSEERPALTVIAGEGLGDATPIRRVRGHKFCQHEHVEVDSRHRQVLCLDCDGLIDSFEALEMLCRSLDRWHDAKATAKRSAQHAEKELAELKREVRNLQAKRRRLRATGVS